MADRDFSLLTYLKSHYPNVPITIVLKVMNKFENDQEKCRLALNEEQNKFTESERGTASPDLNSNNSGDGKSSNRFKELQVSHEGNPRPVPVERHVSTFERSLGGDPKRTVISQSVTWTVQTPERPPSSGSQIQAPRLTPSSMAPAQTTATDFTPYIINRSTSDIPNIDCKTHGSTFGSSNADRPRQVSIPTPNSSSASSSPGETRRPVKVINIPPGSLSGGSVTPAATPPNSRHIRMHFGDTGGVCTVSQPPSSLQRYGSTPDVNQHFRSEIRTEAPVPQSVHSSSIVVNTTCHNSHLNSERNIDNVNDSDPGSGRRTPNPISLNLSSSGSDYRQSPVVNVFATSKPLSTPVQASSPGISHAKPVFAETKHDLPPGAAVMNYPSHYAGNSVRQPPSSLGYNSNFIHQHNMAYNPHSTMNYAPQFNLDYKKPNVYQQPEQHYSNNTSQNHPGYRSPPVSAYQTSTGSGFNLAYQPYNKNVNFPIPASSVVGHASGHPSHMYSAHGVSALQYVPKSQMGGGPQSMLSSRSNSQDSDHSIGVGASPEFDSRVNHFGNMGSRVTSQSSVSSDNSILSDRVDHVPSRPQSGSTQEEIEYITALLLHQKSRMSKLIDDINQHRVVLHNMRADVGQLEKNMIDAGHMNSAFPSVGNISQLCEKNRRLQTDIQMYMNEIDMYKSGKTPFNKIDPLGQQNFFENMPTGQQDPTYARTSDLRSPSPKLAPPPRPPPPIPVRQRSNDHSTSGGISTSDVFNRVLPVPPAQPNINSGESEEGEPWSCSTCTFSNHPALEKCEMCEMSRVKPAKPAPALPPHQPIPPRLPPGLMGGDRSRSGSPASAFGPHQHHRAGT